MHGARLRLVAIVAAVATGLAAAACGGDDDAETTGDPGEIEFELASAGDSGPEGLRAILSFESPDRTRVRVDGLDEGEPGGGGPNPVRLREGSCEEPGDVVAELEDLSGPESASTVELGLDSLLSGDYALEVAVPGQAENVLACGDVPDEAPQ